MKHTVRAFAVGLITAGIILLAVFYFSGAASGNETEADLDELISQIEAEGYRVVTEEQYISIAVGSTPNTEDETEEDAVEIDETNEEQEEATSEDNTEEEQVEEATDSESNETDDADNTDEAEDEEENNPEPVTITIEQGMPTSQISNLLAEHGLIDDAAAFTNYLEEHDYTLRIRFGEYELEQGMSNYEIAERLSR